MIFCHLPQAKLPSSCRIYIFLKLSNLACKSLSIPLSSSTADSAWATLFFAAGAVTEVDGAFKSCRTRKGT